MREYSVTVTILLVLACVFLFNAVGQLKARQPTSKWELTTVASPAVTGYVSVIDTDGVCLYVAISGGTGLAITAVSKTQLPAGAGCQ